MKKLFILLVLIFIPILALSVINDTKADADSEINWDEASPMEIHREMAYHKAQALQAKRDAQKEFMANAMVNAQTDYDVKFYDIDMLIDDVSEFIYANVKMYGLVTGNSINEIQIDFYDNMFIDSIVSSTNSQMSYSRLNNVVTVDLGGVHNNGDSFEFTVYYYGHPITGGLQAFSFSWRNGYRIMSSLSEPYSAKTWWPCKDRMDDKADSFNIAIEVDTSFYAASNGTLDSVRLTTDRFHKFYYRTRYPMATYLFSVAISVYTVWYDEWLYNNDQDTLPIVHAVYPDRYVYSLTHYDIIPQAMGILSENLGQYPFIDEKYGHANFQWGGGMEHQTMTSMTGGDFGFSEPVVVHELGHQWWGDMITCKSWEHIWINEGWASYTEAIYYLDLYGWDYYQNYMNGMAYFGPGSVWVDDTTSVSRIFNGHLSYDKGAWVVHMLRGVLGDSLFFAGVDSCYNSDYKYAAATTEDLRDIFEAVSGMDLDWFFQQWIYGQYYPIYKNSYWQELSDSGGYDVYVALDQYSYAGITFKMPIDFIINLEDGSTDSLTYWLNQEEGLFKLNYPQQVTSIELDPHDWILKDVVSSSWWINIITFPDEINIAFQDQPYLDTIQCRSLVNYNYTEITSGALPEGITIDNAGIISGAPSQSGIFTFSVRFNIDEYTFSSSKEFSIVIHPTDYLPGDADNNGMLDIGDIVFTVEYMFGEGVPPDNLNTVDVNGSCNIDIEDLVDMVDYQFNDDVPPDFGCIL